ncbi:phosphogluconate dehydratase [Escherichia coli]|uniref:Phosphogluconate dehydratase n=1 Tax=Escherichia coli TaxID=562 RepID=A0A3S4KT10_ECOLX|nr:phosphogluconate dehydratase [Escherichia coli]
MARLYPNGPADINHFQAAGGVPVLVRELLKAGLLHEDVNTVAGFGLSRYTLEPWLNNGELDWREGAEKITRQQCDRFLRTTFLSSWWDKSVKR